MVNDWYCNEMKKLEQARMTPEEAAQSAVESWYTPHHMVTHNHKDRIDFNCSCQQGAVIQYYTPARTNTRAITPPTQIPSACHRH